MRSSGVLLPVFSLPSPYGIGCFSKEAYEFIDRLVEAKQTWWQILPLNPTGFGDSPYQSFSTFAGNPYFIDPDTLVEEGLLLQEDQELQALQSPVGPVDYGFQYNNRWPMLRKAFSRFEPDEDYQAFRSRNRNWLDDYALYVTLKNEFQTDFLHFPEEMRAPDAKQMAALREKYREETDFQCFVQYEFFKQWFRLKEYANERGIRIIGDIPIYVAMDSVETWLHHDRYFDFKDHEPHRIAGCPPDGFCAAGQLWGNPVYNWKAMEKDGYDWWYRRIAFALKLYDVIRIDHFRGFDSFYCIPYGAEDATEGEWREGPGIDFFRTIERKLKLNGIEPNIIAEDLGILTDSVRELLKASGYPGMRVLQFAFYDRTSTYLPHNHRPNSIIYPGTHDNQTVNGWLQGLDDTTRQFFREYINVLHRNPDHWDVIRMAMSSVCDTAIVPFADYLGADDKARINAPGTLGENWKWRYRPEDVTGDALGGLKYYTELYGRANPDAGKPAEEDTRCECVCTALPATDQEATGAKEK